MANVDPSGARDSAEYVLLLRRRRKVADLSYRELSRRARQAAEWLPSSTVATMLQRSTLPSCELVTTFIRACGGDDTESAAWLEARMRIAAAAVVPRPAGPPAPDSCGVAPVAAPTRRAPVPPRQLPPAAGMVARARQLAELDAATGSPGPGLAVVTGGPGVGKTALAVHWAHRASNRFPDGQIYVDLVGHGPSRSLPVSAALAHMLVSLGTPEHAVPTDEQQAAGLFRSMVADRRVLLVLDGAASADQVRLLRPAGPGSCTVVTSRHTLVGLVVRDHARVVHVPPLDRPDAVRVLAQATGERLVTAEKPAADVLAGLCDGLPLALRIAATALDRGAPRPIADLVARIRADGRLATLGVPGDPHAQLETTFRYSYDVLDHAERQVFRLLGGQPTAEVTASALAAVREMTVAHARVMLRRLAEWHLVEHLAGDRYAMPGLLHEYACQLARTDPTAGTRSTARDWCERIGGRGRHCPGPRSRDQPHLLV